MTAAGPMDEPVALRRRVLRDGVQDMVLDLLLDGSLPPESAVSIDGLARRLGVSPTPVREALARLETTGLVVRVPLRGYRVAPRLTPEQVRSVMDATGVLEHAALERAFDRQDELVDALGEALEHQVQVVEAAPEPATPRAAFEADWGFHRALRGCAHNEYIQVMGESMSGHLYRVRQCFRPEQHARPDAVGDHLRILEACRAGDRDQAHAALARHLEALSEAGTADRDE